jgi:hypothetical protein
LIALFLTLLLTAAWREAAQLALNQSLQGLQHKLFTYSADETDEFSLNVFYLSWGSVSVYGGFSERCRIGARIRVLRTTERNERLNSENFIASSMSGEGLNQR